MAVKRLVAILFVLLLATSIFSLVSASDTKEVKVFVVEKPYKVDVVFKEPINVTNCTQLLKVVQEKVFGQSNPAIEPDKCFVTTDGLTVFEYAIKKDFITRLNDTIVQSPIPLSGSFVIKVLKTFKLNENGSEYLYIYTGNETEFIGDHTPSVTYRIVQAYDPKKTIYVLPADDGKVTIVFNKDFNQKDIEVSGDVKKYSDGDYTYIVGDVKTIKVLGDDRVYFVYDANCYKVTKDATGKIYVQKVSNQCNAPPDVVTSYNDGKTTIYFLSKNWEVNVYVTIGLFIVGIVLAVFLAKNIEIKKE